MRSMDWDFSRDVSVGSSQWVYFKGWTEAKNQLFQNEFISLIKLKGMKCKTICMYTV